MKISANGSGGFSGTAEHYAIDTATAANGETIEELLRALMLPDTPSVGADLMRWEITIDDGQTRRVLRLAEDGSAPLQALLAELRAND